MSRPDDVYEHDAHGSVEVYWCYRGTSGHWYAKACDFDTGAVAGKKFDAFDAAVTWAGEQRAAQQQVAA